MCAHTHTYPHWQREAERGCTDRGGWMGDGETRDKKRKSQLSSKLRTGSPLPQPDGKKIIQSK